MCHVLGHVFSEILSILAKMRRCDHFGFRPQRWLADGRTDGRTDWLTDWLSGHQPGGCYLLQVYYEYVVVVAWPEKKQKWKSFSSFFSLSHFWLNKDSLSLLLVWSDRPKRLNEWAERGEGGGVFVLVRGFLKETSKSCWRRIELLLLLALLLLLLLSPSSFLHTHARTYAMHCSSFSSSLSVRPSVRQCSPSSSFISSSLVKVDSV